MLNFVQRYGTDSYTKLKGSGGGVGKNWEGPRETPAMDNFKALSSIHYQLSFIIREFSTHIFLFATSTNSSN